MIVLISLIFCFLIFKLSGAALKGAIDNDYITIKPKLLEYLPYLFSILTFWKIPEFLFMRPIKYIESQVFNFFTLNGKP